MGLLKINNDMITKEELLELASHYGEKTKCELLDNEGLNWDNKTMTLDFNFLKELNNGNIRNIVYTTIDLAKRKVAYFGTEGCSGHYVEPIYGDFTHQEIMEVEQIDSDNFYKVFRNLEFKISTFEGYTIFGFPASPDDGRGGCKTVIFIEGEAKKSDFISLINGNIFLKHQFDKLAKLYNVSYDK